MRRQCRAARHAASRCWRVIRRRCRRPSRSGWLAKPTSSQTPGYHVRSTSNPTSGSLSSTARRSPESRLALAPWIDTARRRDRRAILREPASGRGASFALLRLCASLAAHGAAANLRSAPRAAVELGLPDLLLPGTEWHGIPQSTVRLDFRFEDRTRVPFITDSANNAEIKTTEFTRSPRTEPEEGCEMPAAG